MNKTRNKLRGKKLVDFSKRLRSNINAPRSRVGSRLAFGLGAYTELTRDQPQALYTIYTYTSFSHRYNRLIIIIE